MRTVAFGSARPESTSVTRPVTSPANAAPEPAIAAAMADARIERL
jgi:hypothetical protein